MATGCIYLSVTRRSVSQRARKAVVRQNSHWPRDPRQDGTLARLPDDFRRADRSCVLPSLAKCHRSVPYGRGVHGNGEDWDPMGPMGFLWEWE